MEKPNCTWTKWNGEWMVRSDIQLTSENTIGGTYEMIGDQKVAVLGSVEVKNRAGETKVVRIGEYEKALADGHIYSICGAA